ELMARQAASFGQAGLARAAEIVSTGLDQMRGATSPRLLLELMCAQVLLPGAATDEKSLLARLERLENRTPSTVPPAPRPPPAPARAAPAPAASAVDSLRQSWPAILDAVKRESKVAWMLLTNASVLSLEDGILTLRFPRDGEMKGFSVSGHDAILKRVLSNDFGLNAMIKGVAGGEAVTGRPAPAAARPPAVRRAPTPGPAM